GLGEPGVGAAYRHVAAVVLPEHLAGLLLPRVQGREQIVVLAEEERVPVQNGRHSRAPVEDEKRLRQWALPDLLATLRVESHKTGADEVDIDALGVGGRS